MRILLLMFLCHIIDDFALQPVCLSKLKQKAFWVEECKKVQRPIEQYKNDYNMALFIHSLSWSIMIMIPLMFYTTCSDIFFGFCCIINTAIHMFIYDMKANKYSINLIQDQLIHFIQIVLTYLAAIL